jgi:hypothetical protein
MEVFFINSWKMDNLFWKRFLSPRFWLGSFKKDYFDDQNHLTFRMITLNFCGIALCVSKIIYD